MTMHDTAAELSATAADIAASIAEARACPDLLSHARDMLDTLTVVVGGATPAPTVQDALDVLFASRHQLAPDALRSLRDIWDCASAARYGQPYEPWDYDPEFYATHDTAECEQDDI